jgi:transmembrane sensor
MLRGERELCDAEQRAFDAWLASHAGHAASYAQLELICSGLAQLASGQDGVKLRQRGAFERLIAGVGRAARSLSEWLSLTTVQQGFALASVLVVGLWFGLPASQPGSESLSYSTSVAEVRIVPLPDGSEVTLAAGSEIRSEFSELRRDVTLVSGQAFFSVAKDPLRPFFVNTASARIRVVGTRFDVRRNGDRVKVSVEEGIVDVVHKAVGGYGREQAALERQDAEPVRLLAGQLLRLDQEVASEVSSVDSGELASWRQGKLVYHNARLSEVVADANRYRQGVITLGAEQLKELRVTASFEVDQVDLMVAMLEQSLPVQVFHEANDRVVIWPKNSVF